MKICCIKKRLSPLLRGGFFHITHTNTLTHTHKQSLEIQIKAVK